MNLQQIVEDAVRDERLPISQPQLRRLSECVCSRAEAAGLERNREALKAPMQAALECGSGDALRVLKQFYDALGKGHTAFYATRKEG